MSKLSQADWEAAKLKYLASKITSGGTPTAGSPRYYSSVGVPFVKIDDMTRAADRTIEETELHITDAAVRESAAKIFPAGTILISMYGTIGLTKVLREPMATNQAIAALIPEFRCDPSFLAHMLEYCRPVLESAASQTTQANISGKVIREFAVTIPGCKSEQQRIAQVLDTADAAIRSTERLIAKLEHTRQGLLHDLLTRGIDEVGCFRDPVRDPAEFHDTPLGALPISWEVKTLKEASLKITDGVHQTVETATHDADTVPFLYVSCIRDGEIRWSQAGRISAERYRSISQGRVPVPGMILYTAVGSYGHAAVVRDVLEFSFQRHIACIYPDPARIEPWFVGLWLNGAVARAYAERVAIGNAQKTVTLGALAEFPIPVPSMEEQQKLLEIARHWDELRSRELSIVARLRNLKQGLMGDLLTGRVRVPNGEAALG